MKPEPKQYVTHKDRIYDRGTVDASDFLSALERFKKRYNIEDDEEISIRAIGKGSYDEYVSEFEFSYTRIETDEEFARRMEADKAAKKRAKEAERKQYERLKKKFERN